MKSNAVRSMRKSSHWLAFQPACASFSTHSLNRHCSYRAARRPGSINGKVRRLRHQVKRTGRGQVLVAPPAESLIVPTFCALTTDAENGLPSGHDLTPL